MMSTTTTNNRNNSSAPTILNGVSIGSVGGGVDKTPAAAQQTITASATKPIDNKLSAEANQVSDQITATIIETSNENVTNDNTKRSRFEVLVSKIILILSILIVMLLVLVIILSVSLSSKLSANKFKCETSDCLRAASYVVSGINTSFNPCDDFWSFACNGWIEKNRVSDKTGSYSVRDQIRDRIRHDLRHYIDLIPQGVDEADPRFKVKLFYVSCMNVEDIEYTSALTMKYDIQEIGGWSLLSSWSYQSWDKNKVIERLHTKYGVTPYFKVSVGVDDLDPSQPYIIKIEPSGLGLPAKNYYFESKFAKQIDSYKNFMRELAKLFNAQSIQANQFAENMFNYEKRIAEVTPDLEEYQSPADYLRRRYTIKELQSIAPSIKWLDLLQKYFPNSQISETTKVLLAFESYFRNVSHIISTTDNGAINDYLMFRFASAFAPYLSKPFRLIYNEFYQTMNGFVDTPNKGSSSSGDGGEDRWEFCVNIASKYLGHALESMYVKHKQRSSSDAKHFRSHIITPIQNSILNNIDSFFWALSGEARNLIQQKVQQLELRISEPQFVTNDEELKTYYKEFNVQNNFYQNIVSGIYFLNRKNELLFKARQSVSDYSWPLLAYDVDINYQYSGNRLTVPSGILQYPIYDTTLPIAQQFGSIGFEVSAQLLRSLDSIGLQYSMQPDFRLIKQTETGFYADVKQYLDERLRCLYDNLVQQSFKQNLNANLTLHQTYTDIGALMFAYNAYNSEIAYERNGITDQSYLPSSVSSNDQLFYISFAQAMCETTLPHKSLVLSGYETRLQSDIRVITVLRQSRHFANAFGCDLPSDQNMCDLWPQH